MKVASKLCDESFDISDEFNDEFMDDSMFETIRAVAPTYSDTMVACRFFDERNCEKLFQQSTMTEEGLCYTFNAISVPEFSTNEYVFTFF